MASPSKTLIIISNVHSSRASGVCKYRVSLTATVGFPLGNSKALLYVKKYLINKYMNVLIMSFV